MLTTHRSKHAARTAAAALATIALSTGLVACGGDQAADSSGDPAAVQTAGNGDVFNDADVQFATDMIPHHAQAIEMVTYTDGRRLDPEVQQLANAIRDDQSPEVETMVDWLTAWGEEIPETSLDHANAGHGMDDRGDEDSGDMSGDMPGMMSGDEMTALADAPDSEFQDLWLTMMIEHHTGAIDMARAEQENGTFVDAVALAESIESGQQDEIDQMNALLGT